MLRHQRAQRLRPDGSADGAELEIEAADLHLGPARRQHPRAANALACLGDCSVLVALSEQLHVRPSLRGGVKSATAALC